MMPWGCPASDGMSDLTRVPPELSSAHGHRITPSPYLSTAMTTPIEQLVADKRQDIGALCASLAVHELRLFGSAVSALFNPLHSDIDVVVDFYDPQAPGNADRYMALAIGLEEIFQRPVDVVTKQAMKNPVFRRIVENTSELLYAT